MTDRPVRTPADLSVSPRNPPCEKQALKKRLLMALARLTELFGLSFPAPADAGTGEAYAGRERRARGFNLIFILMKRMAIL